MNRGPPAPEAGALTGLRYAPTFYYKISKIIAVVLSQETIFKFHFRRFVILQKSVIKGAKASIRPSEPRRRSWSDPDAKGIRR